MDEQNWAAPLARPGPQLGAGSTLREELELITYRLREISEEVAALKEQTAQLRR